MDLLMKRMTALLIMIVMLLGVLFAIESEQAFAAKKYKLPSKIKMYLYDKEDGWMEHTTTKYEYDKKGNILKEKIWGGGWTKYKNKYKNGKIVKSTGGGVTRTYSKGRCKQEKCGKIVTKFTTNKKGYITSGKGYRKYKNTVKYQSNGMPSKVIHKESGDKITVWFNTDGTIKKTKSVSGKKYEENKYTYEATADKLIATEMYRANGKGDWKYGIQYVYSFSTDTTKEKRKYVSMMGNEVASYVINSLMHEHTFIYGAIG